MGLSGSLDVDRFIISKIYYDRRWDGMDDRRQGIIPTREV